MALGVRDSTADEQAESEEGAPVSFSELTAEEELLAEEVWNDDDSWCTPEPQYSPIRTKEDAHAVYLEGPDAVKKILLAAIEAFDAQTIEMLLSTGMDPNMTLDSPTLSWQSRYPIQVAASLSPYTEENRTAQRDIILSLLSRGAEIFSEITPPPQVETQHLVGSCSIIHTLLEDGAYVSPFLSSDVLTQQNLERRDSRGRTLLLSACRSALGADAAVDGRLTDVHWDPDKGGYSDDPFVGARGRPGGGQQTDSIFRRLVGCGADPTVVDSERRNALHHLLDAHDAVTVPSTQGRPPIIRDSVQYLLRQHDELLHQCDANGRYPLQAAIQRLRRYPIKDSYVEAAELEEIVLDLVAAGAEKEVLDREDSLLLDKLVSQEK